MTLFEKSADRRSGAPSLALPVALLSIAFLTASGFQTVQLLQDRGNLARVYARQQQAVERTLQLRDTVDAFAGDTAKLARAGDPQAKQVVESLRSQHITIRPPAASSDTP